MPNINDYGLPFTSQDGDRKYSALEWREYFSRLIHNGLIQNAANECQVKPQAAPNKTVYVDAGVVFINGAMRVLEEPVTLTVAENTSGNPRIDRVVARLNEASRTIEFAVLEGTPAGSPVAPALTRTAGVYELGLADVTLANGYSAITETEITDQRSDVDLCGASSMTIGVIPPKGLDAVTVQLEPETKALYGVENVDEAFQVIPFISMAGFNAYNCSDATIETDTTLATSVNVYNNLTINNGVTLTCVRGVNILYVKGTLTLNGVISAKGKGGTGGAATAYGNMGGTGGGIILLFAKNIIGNGTIDASGENGNPPTQNSPPSGQASANGGQVGSFRGHSTGGVVKNSFASLSPFFTCIDDIGGGGGAGGGYDNSSPYIVLMGAGGNGVIGSGGVATSGNALNGQIYPGSGGGGGAIIIICPTGIPTLTLLANGGNGATGFYGYVGSGGGGGLISILAPTNGAVCAATGGTGGGQGSAGLVEFFSSL